MDLEINVATIGAAGEPIDDEKREHESAEDESSEEEVEEELEVLKEDNEYFEFVATVNKKPGQISNDEDPSDTEFVPEVALDLSSKGAEGQEEDDDGSSSDDSSVYEEASEELEDVNFTREDCSIPPEALKEAIKRFPPFWRTKSKIARIEEEYKSDEDSNFEISEEEKEMEEEEEVAAEGKQSEAQGQQGSAEVIDVPSSSSSEDEGDDAEIEKDEMENLVEMAEDLAIIEDHTPAAAEILADQPPAECLARSIAEFDPTTYNEADDPDYVPPVPISEIAELASDSSSSDDDDDESVDGMDAE